MFFGHIHTPASYQNLVRAEAILKALRWIREMPEDQSPGIYEVEGRDLFVNVHGYDTFPPEECRFESHRKYVDIQYCIEGGERIDVEWASRLTADGDFDAEKDLQFYRNNSSRITTSLAMASGDFAIFYPEDAHRPKIHDGRNPAVRKLVVKINRALLD